MLKIAIIGQQCSGKTSIAKHLTNIFPQSVIYKIADPIYSVLDCLCQTKNRAFMQEFGDLAKKHFGENVFTEIFKKNVIEKERLCETCSLTNSVIICDDIRRLYELDVVKELGFKVVSIKAPAEIRKARAEKLGLDFIENHNSETEVPDLIDKADYKIIDNGDITIDDLFFIIKEALTKL